MSREEAELVLGPLREYVMAEVSDYYAASCDGSGSGRAVVARIAFAAGRFLGRRYGATWEIEGLDGYVAGQDYVVQMDLWPPGATAEVTLFFHLPMHWCSWGAEAHKNWRTVMGFFDSERDREVERGPDREMEELVA